jgi:hypothetical protein
VGPGIGLDDVEERKFLTIPYCIVFTFYCIMYVLFYVCVLFYCVLYVLLYCVVLLYNAALSFLSVLG